MKIPLAIGACALITLLVIVGNADKHEAALEHLRYCDNVSTGAWGAYREGEVSCDEETIKKLEKILKKS